MCTNVEENFMLKKAFLCKGNIVQLFTADFEETWARTLQKANIDEVLSINPSANVFVFGDFNIHHKDWLTYSGGTDWPGELL